MQYLLSSEGRLGSTLCLLRLTHLTSHAQKFKLHKSPPDYDPLNWTSTEWQDYLRVRTEDWRRGWEKAAVGR